MGMLLVCAVYVNRKESLMSKMKDKLISQMYDYLDELYSDDSYQEWLLKEEKEDLEYQIEHDSEEEIPF
jgi:hypothetical protein